MSRCSSQIGYGDIQIFEVSQKDKGSLEICINKLDYIRKYTGWIGKSKDEAQDLIDHIELPKDWKKEKDRVYLIKKDGNCIGYTQFYEGAFSEDRIFLGFLGIIPENQKNGAGGSVYKMLEDEFKKNGYKKIRINVGSRNVDALSFWIEKGFTAIVKKFKYESGFLDMNLEKEI